MRAASLIGYCCAMPRRPRDPPDPRSTELEQWMREQRPEAELVYRLAWCELSPHARGDRAWKTRIAELWKVIDPSSQERARLIREAGRGAVFLRKGL